MFVLTITFKEQLVLQREILRDTEIVSNAWASGSYAINHGCENDWNWRRIVKEVLEIHIQF